MRRGARIYFLFMVHKAPASKSIAMYDLNEAFDEESLW